MTHSGKHDPPGRNAGLRLAWFCAGGWLRFGSYEISVITSYIVTRSDVYRAPHDIEKRRLVVASPESSTVQCSEVEVRGFCHSCRCVAAIKESRHLIST